MWSNCFQIFIRYHRTILFVLSRAVMVTLCSYQLWSITETYTGGDTISKVNLSFPDYLTLPSVSLCINFLETLNQTSVVSVYPSMAPIFTSSKVYAEDYLNRHNNLFKLYQFIGNQSLKELKGFMKTSLDTLLEDITPTQLELDDGSSATCNSTRYLHEPLFCFTITCVHPETGEPAQYNRQTIFEPRYGGRMLTIGLNWSTVSQISHSMLLMLTAPGSLIGGSYHSSYALDLTSSPTTFIITYSMIRNDLGSVSTQCTNEGSPNQGRGDKVIRYNYCTNHMLRSIMRLSFYQTIQLIDRPSHQNLKPGYQQYYREFLTSDLTQREHDRNVFNRIRTICKQQTKSPNCIDEIYTPIGDHFAEKDKSDFTIVVNAPTVPFENNEFSLEITLLDYLIYVSSSLSFWFGVSVISIVDRLQSAAFNHLDSKRSLVRSQNTNNPVIGQQLIRRTKKSAARVGKSRVLSKFNKQFGDNYNYLTFHHDQLSSADIKY